MVNEVILYEDELIDYIKENFKENAHLQISYNRIFIPGKILFIDIEDDNVIITLQLEGEILNQVIEINIKSILSDIIELRYITNTDEVVIVVNSSI
ncbi:DUF2097 domain-containing protein [Methanosphaera cuniculi]|uniref:DUF2097 domain-containing protein n=1 Tax=Methanosphaera cuniculi TaxID=1077256 RepID=A0A2A2HB16_9EURY|nr:DUF2097 domain-containing protein [Methanosphaera cuniculi]PAV06506.1 hypothetical protein ASJ82_04620 [Methanosphaera cuniculi]PWL09000.1 hypothetical protein MSCUN_00610 [Methanosphaera cuniculi]